LTAVTALWLPILVSAVLVFLDRSVIHMATSWHAGDYQRVPDEDRVADALRGFGLPPGDYMLPRASSMKEMGTPEFKEKMDRGPRVIFTVMPNGQWGMGGQLSSWFAFALVVGLFGGYVAGLALPPGADYRIVFRFVSVTAFLGYSLALWQMSIWYSRSWMSTIRSTVDGLVYALLTAGVFGWLWPAV
jgi:hypothetical protein